MTQPPIATFSLNGGRGSVSVYPDRLEVSPPDNKPNRTYSFEEYPNANGDTQIYALDGGCRTYCCKAHAHGMESCGCSFGNVIHINQCASLGCCGAQFCSRPMIYNVDDPYGLMMVWEQALQGYHRRKAGNAAVAVNLPISFYYPGNVHQQVMSRGQGA
jgi:hypothetical protein